MTSQGGADTQPFPGNYSNSALMPYLSDEDNPIVTDGTGNDEYRLLAVY